MVGVAVKVTGVPEQIVLADEEILITGTTEVETLIVIVFEVAFDGLAQAAFDVIVQVILSLLLSELLEYVELFVPTFDPFSCH